MSILKISQKFNNFRNDIFKNFIPKEEIIPKMNYDEFINNELGSPVVNRLDTCTEIENIGNNVLIENDFKIDTSGLVVDLPITSIDTTINMNAIGEVTKLELYNTTVTCDIIQQKNDVDDKNIKVQQVNDNEGTEIKTPILSEEDTSYDQITPVPNDLNDDLMDEFEVLDVKSLN